MTSFAPAPLSSLSSSLPLAAFLAAHLRSRSTPIECRNCGNPDVAQDTPCRFCGVVTAPKRSRPHQCPRCGATPIVEMSRNIMSHEIEFYLRCHGASERAAVSMESFAIADDLRTLVAERLADAIDRLS